MATTVPESSQPTTRPVMTRHARRVTIAVVGGSTVAAGVLLLALPGPGTLVIIAGLSILGREFPRARRAADKGKGMAVTAVDGAKRGAGRVGGWFKQ